MKESHEQNILEVLQERQYATVEELAAKLYVSPSTIRRALNALQNKHLIIRTHGGVKINETHNSSPNFSFRIHQNSFEKKKMALSAIKLIKNGDIIFLDGSTSAFYIAEYLKEFKDIRVVTNGIDTLSLLAKNNVRAYSTGGQVSVQNPSVLVGRYAEDTIGNFHANIAFFSAQALNSDGSIYDCFEKENFIRRAMMKHSGKSVFLCDDTKTGKQSSFYLCDVKDVDYIVSNKPLPDIESLEGVTQIINV